MKVFTIGCSALYTPGCPSLGPKSSFRKLLERVVWSLKELIDLREKPTKDTIVRVILQCSVLAEEFSWIGRWHACAMSLMFMSHNPWIRCLEMPHHPSTYRGLWRLRWHQNMFTILRWSFCFKLLFSLRSTLNIYQNNGKDYNKDLLSCILPTETKTEIWLISFATKQFSVISLCWNKVFIHLINQ